VWVRARCDGSRSELPQPGLLTSSPSGRCRVRRQHSQSGPFNRHARDACTLFFATSGPRCSSPSPSRCGGVGLACRRSRGELRTWHSHWGFVTGARRGMGRASRAEWRCAGCWAEYCSRSYPRQRSAAGHSRRSRGTALRYRRHDRRACSRHGAAQRAPADGGRFPRCRANRSKGVLGRGGRLIRAFPGQRACHLLIRQPLSSRLAT
jgi:hypothetical protein